VKVPQQHGAVVASELGSDREARLFDLHKHVAKDVADGVNAAHLIERIFEGGIGGIQFVEIVDISRLEVFVKVD
jgi:hypothetical protein